MFFRLLFGCVCSIIAQLHLIICLTRLHDTYILLLKQNLQRMNVWLNMAESRTKLEEEIGPEYDDVRKQLEDHQVR